MILSTDCTSCHVAEIPSRYRNSRPSPTVFSGYTVGPESSGLYIGGAFRPRVDPAGLPWGAARPEHVLVRPDSVHCGPPGSPLHSNTGDHIQPVYNFAAKNRCCVAAWCPVPLVPSSATHPHPCDLLFLPPPLTSLGPRCRPPAQPQPTPPRPPPLSTQSFCDALSMLLVCADRLRATAQPPRPLSWACTCSHAYGSRTC